jgi:hypothetical protein
MAQEVIYLTAEGYKKLKDELDHMRSVERPAASAAIAEARDKGDLSENAEYDAAREAQGMLEMKIAQMEATLANARVIDEQPYAAPFLDALFHAHLAVFGIGIIGLNAQKIPLRLFVRRRTRGDGHLPTLAQKPVGDTAADTAAAAGHKCRFQHIFILRILFT